MLVDDFADFFADAHGRDPMFFIMGDLFVAAAFGFVQCCRHRFGHFVGIENYAAINIAGGAADGLD